MSGVTLQTCIGCPIDVGTCTLNLGHRVSLFTGDLKHIRLCWILVYVDTSISEFYQESVKNLTESRVYLCTKHYRTMKCIVPTDTAPRYICDFLVHFLQNICMDSEKSHYSGPLNGTIHVVAGGGGAHLAEFTTLQMKWSLYRDFDYGFVKLTAFNSSSLLLEYKKSSDGNVYDSFTINRDYRDILACTKDSCSSSTMAS